MGSAFELSSCAKFLLRHRAVVLLAAGALALASSGCVPNVGVTPIVTPPPATVLATAPQPGLVDERVCVDGSSSVDQILVASFVDSLATIAESWPQPLPADTTKGVQPSPGLRLTVRKVLANSLDPAALVGQFSIPGVPGVVPKPPLNTSADVPARDAWGHQVQASTTGAAEAVSAAATVAGQLRAADYKSDSSDVRGCIAALTQGRTSGLPLLLVVFSDLRQATTTQDEPKLADFTDARLLVVNADIKPKRAYSHQQSLARWITDLGAQVTFVRPELAADAIRSFMVGGASS